MNHGIMLIILTKIILIRTINAVCYLPNRIDYFYIKLCTKTIKNQIIACAANFVLRTRVIGYFQLWRFSQAIYYQRALNLRIVQDTNHIMPRDFETLWLSHHAWILVQNLCSKKILCYDSRWRLSGIRHTPELTFPFRSRVLKKNKNNNPRPISIYLLRWWGSTSLWLPDTGFTKKLL